MPAQKTRKDIKNLSAQVDNLLNFAVGFFSKTTEVKELNLDRYLALKYIEPLKIMRRWHPFWHAKLKKKSFIIFAHHPVYNFTDLMCYVSSHLFLRGPFGLWGAKRILKCAAR